jgi:cobalt-precorrin 5A hydrolase
VREVTGVGNVCERAAVCEGGKLIVGKTAKDGITVALSAKDWRVEF